MNVNDLIQKLKAQGIETTPQQIEQALGSVEYLTEDDIPSIVEMLAGSAKPVKRNGGKLDKPKAGSIAPLDASNLPQVASLSNVQVDAYIAQIEQLDQSGESIPDSLVSFLCDLYDRRQQAIELAVGAVQRFKAQDTQLNQAMSQLNAALGGSVQGLQDAQQQLAAIGAGGARLGDRFRSNTASMRAAADRFAAHCDRAGQSRAEAESSVA